MLLHFARLGFGVVELGTSNSLHDLHLRHVSKRENQTFPMGKYYTHTHHSQVLAPLYCKHNLSSFGGSPFFSLSHFDFSAAPPCVFAVQRSFGNIFNFSAHRWLFFLHRQLIKHPQHPMLVFGFFFYCWARRMRPKHAICPMIENKWNIYTARRLFNCSL